MTLPVGIHVEFKPEKGKKISLPCRYVELERRLGGRVRWRFLVHSRLNEDSKLLHDLGLALGGGRVYVEATWDQEKRLYAKSFQEIHKDGHFYLVSKEGAKLGPYETREEAHKAHKKLESRPIVHHHKFVLGPKEKVLVTGSQWQKEFNHLLVEATSTLIKEDGMNATLPRWRVHHVDTLEKLAKKFKDLCLIPDNGVGNQLQEITFGDKAWANQIQGGISDWDWVRGLLWHYQGFTRELSMKPLVISGSVSEKHGTNGRWIFTWGRKESYEALGEVESRSFDWGEETPSHEHPPKHHDTHPHPEAHVEEQIEDEIYQGTNRALFGSAARSARSYHLPGVPVPQSGLVRHRRAFSEDAWKQWRTRDVPLFTKKDHLMCWRVVDKLYDTTSPDTLGWTTKVEFLPPKTIVPQEHPMLPLSRWTSRAKVAKQYRKGPWIELEMPGCFNKSKNENICYARLTTAHAGKDGDAGFHLIPEKDTKVAITWSGQFDESVLCLGNIRMKPTEYQHPSCWLESDSISHFQDIRVKSIGKTDINSDWRVGVKKETSIDSGKKFTVAGDGVRSDYKSSVKHVAKGKSSAPWKAETSFMEMLQKLPEMLKDLQQALKDLKKLIQEGSAKVKEVLAKLKELMKNAKDLQKLLKEAPEKAKELLATLRQVPDALKEIAKNLKQIPEALDSLNQTLQQIPETIRDLSAAVKGLPKEIAKEVKETAQVLTQGVSEVVRESTQAFKQLPAEALKEALNALPENVKTIPKTIAALPEMVKNLPPEIAKELVKQLPQTLQNLPADVTKTLAASQEMAANLKPELLKSLPAGVQKLPKELSKAAPEIMKQVPDFSRQMNDLSTKIPGLPGGTSAPAAMGLTGEAPVGLVGQGSQLLDAQSGLLSQEKQLLSQLPSDKASLSKFVDQAKPIGESQMKVAEQAKELIGQLPSNPEELLGAAKKEIPSLGNLRRPRGNPLGL